MGRLDDGLREQAFFYLVENQFDAIFALEH